MMSSGTTPIIPDLKGKRVLVTGEATSQTSLHMLLSRKFFAAE